MTNEEFIKQLYTSDFAELLCDICQNCDYCPGAKRCEFNGGTANGLKKWLKEEYKGE